MKNGYIGINAESALAPLRAIGRSGADFKLKASFSKNMPAAFLSTRDDTATAGGKIAAFREAAGMSSFDATFVGLNGFDEHGNLTELRAISLIYGGSRCEETRKEASLVTAVLLRCKHAPTVIIVDGIGGAVYCIYAFNEALPATDENINRVRRASYDLKDALGDPSVGVLSERACIPLAGQSSLSNGDIVSVGAMHPNSDGPSPKLRFSEAAVSTLASDIKDSAEKLVSGLGKEAEIETRMMEARDLLAEWDNEVRSLIRERAQA